MIKCSPLKSMIIKMLKITVSVLSKYCQYNDYLVIWGVPFLYNSPFLHSNCSYVCTKP